jgi:triphosphatase
VDNQTTKQDQSTGSGMERTLGAERSSGDGSSSKNERRVPEEKKLGGTDHQEVEWQFEDADLERVESWLEERAEDLSIAIGPGAKKELVDTYYDTEDWRLYRAGYALRIRRADKETEATMKSLTAAGSGDRGGTSGNAWRRREISEPLENGEVENLLKARGPVGERLRALAGVRELRPLFEVHTNRQTFDLVPGERAGGPDVAASRTDGSSEEIVQDASGDIRRAGAANGSRIGEVALDRSEIPLGGGEVASLTRVEVEADVAKADTVEGSGLEGLVEVMEEALELRPARVSKYEAGLFATGLTPEGARSLGPVAVDDSLSVGEVAFRVLRWQFAAMGAHESGTRLGEDPEELHDMRVATRRMRAAIKLFEDTLPERARWLRGELKWVAVVLGEVRDLDVQIEQLKRWVARADEDGREPLSEVVSAVEERRDAARELLLEALDSERYARFESSFAEMLRRGPAGETGPGEGPGVSAVTGEPILAAAPGLLSRPYRKWRKAAGRINGTSRPEEYHDLRKKGKRLRYALEFLSDVYGEEATGGIVKPLKTLQDDLGRHQDLIVAAGLLEQLATEGRKLPPRTAFAMGGLAQRNLREAADLRASLPDSDAYRALYNGKAWKDFEKVMKKQRSGVTTGSGKEK